MIDAAIWAKALGLVGILFIAYILAMWVGIVFWTRRDIRSRTADQTQRFVAVAVVALFHAPGFLLYLAMRPAETSAERLERELEAEALVQDIERQSACPGCGHSMSAEFVACPYCRTPVQTCGACSRSVRPAWVVCPYCGADRRSAPVAAPSSASVRAERIPSSPRGTLPQAPPRRTYSPTAKA